MFQQSTDPEKFIDTVESTVDDLLSEVNSLHYNLVQKGQTEDIRIQSDFLLTYLKYFENVRVAAEQCKSRCGDGVQVSVDTRVIRASLLLLQLLELLHGFNEDKECIELLDCHRDEVLEIEELLERFLSRIMELQGSLGLSMKYDDPEPHYRDWMVSIGRMTVAEEPAPSKKRKMEE